MKPTFGWVSTHDLLGRSTMRGGVDPPWVSGYLLMCMWESIQEWGGWMNQYGSGS